jgi:hypothetical protein
MDQNLFLPPVLHKARKKKMTTVSVHHLEVALFQSISEGIETVSDIPKTESLITAMERIELLERNISDGKISYAKMYSLEQHNSSDIKLLRDKVGTLEARVSEFQATKRNAESLQCGLPTPTKQQTNAETRASSFDAEVLIESLQRKMSEKVSTGQLEQSLSDLKKEVHAIKVEANHYNKMKVLAWAIENADLGEFTYYSYTGTKHRSKDLVLFILLSFRRKRASCTFSSHYTIARHLEDGKQKFREKLSHQIEQLTGVIPTFERQKDGDYAIYYS